MKKIISFILIILCLLIPCVNLRAAEPDISGESAILMESTTGKIIYEKNPDIVLRPASITKIMTLILIFDALHSGQINLSDSVTVSEYAASMGGSQVFLEAGEIQTVETLIKCIAISSANDACVAMAEYICGSEDAFVAKMNERSQSLNMNNTNFVNCCGLDVDGHVTTARDVATMSRELSTKYPEIHEISTIWMDTITHVTRRGSKDFTLTNTNKLLKQYEWATGLKTGSTSLAGFCLSATAKRDNIELISVVMAAKSSKERVSDSIKLLNHGYSSCSIYKDTNMPEIPEIPIKNSLCKSIQGIYNKEFTYLFTEKYAEEAFRKDFEFLDNLKAPIKKGDVIGQLVYYYDEKPIGSVDIISDQNIKKAFYKDFLGKIASNVFCI